MDSIRSKSTVRLPPSANIKIGLLIASVLVVIGTLLYSHRLVDELKEREQRIAKFFGDALRYAQNTEDFDAALYLMIVEYARNSGVPMIVTDGDNKPSFTLATYKKFNINVPFDTTLAPEEQMAFLQNEIQRMDKTFKAIRVTYTDPVTRKETVTNYIHYGDSIILSKIEELPLIQLLLGAVVVVIGYLSFAYLKRSEQSNIWVGMSKETAHQLGTPLSSLLGWAEMLRLNAFDPKEVNSIAVEIEKDIERLNRIAIRFSKIGAIPDLKEQNIVTIISGVMGYLEDSNLSCKLTGRAAQFAIVDKLAAQSGKNCTIKDRRFIGAASSGKLYYEVACQDGKGYVLEQSPNGAYSRAIDCAQADALAGGCTLSDTRQAKTEQAGLYTKLAKGAGFNCDVSGYAPFSVSDNGKEVVELVCSNRPDGGVGIFAATASGSSEVLDCAHSELKSFRCSLTKPSAAYPNLTADLKRLGKSSCMVSNSRVVGVTTDGLGYVEVACSDGLPGYMISYTMTPFAPKAPLACTEARGIAGGCTLPGNKKG